MAAATSSSRIPAGLIVIHPARTRQGSRSARPQYASRHRSRVSHPKSTYSQERTVYGTLQSTTVQTTGTISPVTVRHNVNNEALSGRRGITAESAAKRTSPFLPRYSIHSKTLKNWILGVPLVTLAALAILGVLAFITPHTANAGNEPHGTGTRYVTVQSGDTLWDIAQEVDPKTDPRDTMVHISRLNDLQGSTVKVGQRLEVPHAQQ